MLMSKARYEERILFEVKALPRDALPKVLKLLFVIKDEFLAQESDINQVSDDAVFNHAETKRLLNTSKSNWADDVIAVREDRL